MRVALLQVASPDDESVESRRARIDEAIRAEAGLGDVDLLVLPELWAVGCYHFNDYAAAAEPLDGPSVEFARGWARLHDLYVHTGSFVELDDGVLYNTSAIVAPNGEIVAKYRKIHLFGTDEAERLTPGASVSVVPLGDMTLGAATCYDLRFPELFRSIIDAGATVTALCSAWPATRAEHWRLLTSARALEDQMYVVACNAVGTHGRVASSGESRVVDPWGVVVAESGTDEGFLYADIDATMPASVRTSFPAVADRRWPLT